MNFKTKAIGLLAGSALALSLTTGAMADDQDAVVTLDEDTNAAGCVITGTSLPSFGTIEWGGSSYANPANQTLTVALDFETGFPGETGTCSATILGEANFTGTGANTDTIAVGKLAHDGTPMTTSAAALDTGVDPSTDITSSMSLDLTGITVQPDTYTNTLTITVSTD